MSTNWICVALLTSLPLLKHALRKVEIRLTKTPNKLTFVVVARLK